MPFYGKVEKPFWDNRPVAIVGGGPSLLGFDFEQLRGAHVLAVKWSMFDIPWADAGFAIGMARYAEWRGKLGNVQSRVYWAVQEDQAEKTGPPPAGNVTFLKRIEGGGISDDPGVVYCGGTSTFGAFQVAIHKRATRIVLFGFDYDGAYKHVLSRRRGDYRSIRKQAEEAANWLTWANYFRLFLPHLNRNGIRVLNACETSAIDCFERITLEDGADYIRSSL